MSLYAKFLQEENLQNIIENDRGFIVYEYLTESEVYVAEIYITPDFRGSSEAKKLADQVATEAREKGCKAMTATVWVDLNRENYTAKKLQSFLHYGFVVKKVNDNTIVLCKSLEDK